MEVIALRGDGGRGMGGGGGAGCLRRFGGPCFLGDEGIDGLVVLAPTLGGCGPAGDEGTGRRVVGPYGGWGGFMALISWEKKAETFA